MTNRAAEPAPSRPLLLVVAAALVNAAGEVLVQRRPAHKEHGDLWEFPGGKVEPGESPEHALARELAEELGIGTDPADMIRVAFASRTDNKRHLVLLLYRIERWTGEPRAIEATAIAWHPTGSLASIAMPPADHHLAAALLRWERGG